MSEPILDPRVDAYIAARQLFARPILLEIRARVHAALPNVGETMKWSMPFFQHGGRPLANMAGFKAHASFGFWRHGEVTETGVDPKAAMGQFGRLTSVEDLPAEAAFAEMLRKAAAIIDAGASTARPVKHAKAALETPSELVAAFAADGAALATWDGFPPSGRRDYAEWIEGAKRAETRARRVATALAQIAEGKRLNWRHEKR